MLTIAYKELKMSACGLAFSRRNNKVAEMVGQKPSIAILLPDLVKHPIHCIREIMYQWSDILPK